MTEITHRIVETNGIRMHIAEQGTGPLVLLCHGFPECWYSWRHQLSALAEAGFHAVAPHCMVTFGRVVLSRSPCVCILLRGGYIRKSLLSQ